MFPIILSDNRFLGGIPTATGTAAGYDVLNIRDCRTYTWWKGAAAGTNYVTANCPAAGYVDCLAVIGHNLKSASALVSLESYDGAVWTERLAPFTPASDKAFIRTIAGINALDWRIKIVTAAIAPQLAVVMAGRRIDFPFPPDEKFSPFVESVEEESQTSKAGNPLGTVVRFFPVEIKPQFSHVDRSWVETVYRPFREGYGRYRKYFFWAWDIDAYPDQVFFVRDVGKYDPTVSTLAYYDKLKLDLKGIMEP